MSNKLDLAAYGVAEITSEEVREINGGLLSLVALCIATVSLFGTGKSVGWGLVALAGFVVSCMMHE